MGGSPSSSAEGKEILNSHEVKSLVEDLGMKKSDARYFFDLFSDLDADKGGSISLDEFYNFFGIMDRTPFADRAFSVLDEDNSGELDYHEFLAGIWSLCSSSDFDLCSFLFSLFDEDGSQTLDDAEIESALRMLHNADPLPDDVKESFDELVKNQRANHTKKNDGMLLQDIEDTNLQDADGDSQSRVEDDADIEISLDEFTEFNRKHPILLHPALNLRDTIRRQIRGKKYWLKMQKKRAEHFSGMDLDQILFSNKRAKAAAEAEERQKREKQRKENIKKLKAIRKRKKEEEYQARVKDKWENAIPEETEYREAHKALERARELWEEAEEEGKSQEECVQLRRRLQMAQDDMEEAQSVLFAVYQKQMESEMAKCEKLAEQRVRKKLSTRKAKRRIAKDAKMMRWVFKLLPRVDPVFEGFDKISYNECKEKVILEHIQEAIKQERKKVKKKHKLIRKDEERFIRDEVLADPWADGPWDEEETESEESEEESVFMGDEDWELHVSVDGCHFVSVDVRQWHEITGSVPPRILHAAGIHVQKFRKHRASLE